MYCYYCGKKIDERKLEASKSSLESNKDFVNESTKIEYICPRCGHLIHNGIEEKDLKSLSQASHAQIQRGRNAFASGMGNLCIGIIGFVIAMIFFQLAHKPAQHYMLITSCPEFFVFVVLLAASIVLIAIGTVFTTIGIVRRREYSHLLKDIKNKTFYQ